MYFARRRGQDQDSSFKIERILKSCMHGHTSAVQANNYQCPRVEFCGGWHHELHTESSVWFPGQIDFQQLVLFECRQTCVCTGHIFRKYNDSVASN